MRDDLYSDEHRRLREILKRERLAAGLRQSDIASQTGRSQAYISKFEKGDLRLDVVDLVRICEVIGCSFVVVVAETFAWHDEAYAKEAAYILNRDAQPKSGKQIVNEPDRPTPTKPRSRQQKD